jgi:hypothetical protein
MSVIPSSPTQQTTVAPQLTDQPPVMNSQPIRSAWDSETVHATIDSTCDKVGTFIIDAGNVVGGPAAVASLNQGTDTSKDLITSYLPDAAPFANTVLDIVKIPLSVVAQRCGPPIAESCVVTVMPVSRNIAHGSANLVEKSAGYSKSCCS